jgi:hypothetical protein
MYGHLLPTEFLAHLFSPIMMLFGGSQDDADEGSTDHGSQIGWLRSLGDREALFQIMEQHGQFAQGLEAAAALAELGDVRGLDFLIDTLDCPDADLQDQAAEVLHWLGHPRGLRALRDHAREPGDMPSSRGQSSQLSPGSDSARSREQLYEELNQRDTDELVAMWHEYARAREADPAFEVMEAILIHRLGRLPRGNASDGSRSREDIDENADPGIQHLWMEGDTDALASLLRNETDAALRLGAAEALADLGSEDALDLLIDALDDADEDAAELAASLLDWLNLPRGNTALQDRGYEFEAPEDTLSGEPGESRPQPVQYQTQTAATPRDSWVANQRMPPTSKLPRMPSSQGETVERVWQERVGAFRLPIGLVATGAAGGVLGLMAARVSLHLLGLFPLPQAVGDWLQPSMLYLLAISIIVGAAFGTLGGRIADDLAARGGREINEGDLSPVLGALFGGAVFAMLADVLLFFLMDH